VLLTFYGIAALSVTFFLAVKKKVTKEKLPAAPDSVKVSADCSVVLAEPDDADSLLFTFGQCFLYSFRVFFERLFGN